MTNLSREDLVAALSGPLMTDDEFAARILLGKTGGYDMKTVTTPRRLLEQAGGAGNLELLRDVLMREPEPGSGLLLTLRGNVIDVIAAIRDERAVEPLASCFQVHRLWEDKVIELLAGAGATVPERYSVLADVLDPEDLKSMAPERYDEFQDLIADSYLEGRQDALPLVAVTSAKVRAAVATALGVLHVRSSTEFLGGVIGGQERSDLVRWSAAAALAAHADPRAVDPLVELLPWAASAWGIVPRAEIRQAANALAGFEDDHARAGLVALYEQLPDDEENRDLRRYVGERAGLLKPKRRGWFRR